MFGRYCFVLVRTEGMWLVSICESDFDWLSSRACLHLLRECVVRFGNRGFSIFIAEFSRRRWYRALATYETRMTYLDRLTKGVDGSPIFEPSSNFYGHSWDRLLLPNLLWLFGFDFGPEGGSHMVIAFVSQLVILHVRVGDRKGGRTSGNKWSYVRLRDELGHNYDKLTWYD